jgi:hypothetical protein
MPAVLSPWIEATAACWYSWPERARPAPPSPFRRRHWRRPPAALTGRLGWPTDLANLDRVDATSVGRLLAASGTSDIADAHVVICARRSAQPVVTSDPGDLSALDPTIRLITL